MASSSSPLSLSIPLSSLSRNCEHDVFMSFHGADVRKAFLSHIIEEFRSKGINIFIDNKIKRGEFIGPQLKKAIQGSRIKIVLLSKRYASSSWCLNELVEIMMCKKELGQSVITIFYEVDPTDVKKQTGDFGNIFRKTCASKTIVVIGKWRQALAKVATIAGYHSRNWDNEADMIKQIAIEISKMLNHSTPSCDFDRLIGMEAHMRKLEPLLSLDLKEVRMIGIWGPSGIGKSTIARYLFNQVSSSFQLSTIMVNIKGTYPRPCLDEYSANVELQKQLLSQLFNEKDIVIPHLGVVRDRLGNKKVLVVLDDVDQSVQLDAMAEKTQWFGPGSRIIVTTEDLRVLEAHRINNIYKVEFPSYSEAFQIFCMNAFGQNSPKDGFTELAHEVTHLAGELPLGLKVMGSHFREISKQKWEMALRRLRYSLDGKIESILMFSYNSLCDEDKDLFLHIACFFNYEDMKKVEEHLEGSFTDVRLGLQVLADKALVSIAHFGRIEMHKLLVQLGREIVRKQSVRKPWKRQFLVDERDICEVLNNDISIAKSVIGMNSIVLSKHDELRISVRAFEGMSNLQFLRISGDSDHPSLPGRLNYIFPKLRLLDWKNSPMTHLPFIVNHECLVELRMIDSKLEKLWEGTKPLRNLKRIELSYSENLTELPNLSTAISLKVLNVSGCSSLVELPFSLGDATNLQDLDLSHCSSLVKLPYSIGHATNLQDLNLSHCSSLVDLPSSIGDATNLKDLNLSHCLSLVNLPSSIGDATNLEHLDLSGCSNLVELPSSIGNETKIQYLDLSDCSRLVELPSSIGNATSLRHLKLNNCSNLVKLPSSIGNAINLQELYLCGCSKLGELPSSIWNATSLQVLNLSYCSNLVELPSSIENATNLEELYLSGCSNMVELPSSIGNATNLQYLYLSHCSKLVELPSSIGNATNLEVLDLSHCSSLVKLPSSIGNVTNLRHLMLIYCSSLVELPSSIGNLRRLPGLNLEGCSKLKVLPTISFTSLDLSDCSLLKSLPEISTNIEYLYLKGTSIEVPSSIKSWSNLEELHMSYSENLKDSPHALDSITELHLTNTEIKELGPWVKEFSRLRRLVLNGIKKLVSLPKLPGSLVFLDAENCESLERLDCSFHNQDISLNFRNCFKLNQEARDLIIKTSTREVVVLPGREVPAYFTFQASDSFVRVKLIENPLRTSTKFRACILLVNDGVWDKLSVSCSVWSKQNALTACRPNKRYPKQILSEHLYIFEVEVDNVTSTELVFEFKLKTQTVTSIKECGILHVDGDYESLRDCDEYSNSSDSDYLSPVEEIKERRSSRSSIRRRRSKNYWPVSLL